MSLENFRLITFMWEPFEVFAILFSFGGGGVRVLCDMILKFKNHVQVFDPSGQFSDFCCLKSCSLRMYRLVYP